VFYISHIIFLLQNLFKARSTQSQTGGALNGVLVQFLTVTIGANSSLDQA